MQDDTQKRDDQSQPVTDDQLEAVSDEQDQVGPGSVQDPMSPHGIPQNQDEEIEKAETAEKGAGVHPEPAAEEELHTDLDTVKPFNKPSESDEEQDKSLDDSRV